MNNQIIIRACIVGVVILLLMAGWQSIKDANPGTQLVAFILVGAGAGIFAIVYVMPWIGDAISTMMLSSGEEIQRDDQMKAVAKVAQGDYDGAIELYKNVLRDKPEDPFPIAEISKIYLEKMGDSQRALDFIQEHLEQKEWPVDDAAFLMFRMVDIHVENLKDYDTARELLQEVIANFPNTRHSANANHKLHEVEQAQYKLIMEQRLKSSAEGSGGPVA